jgi:TPR repeat protein
MFETKEIYNKLADECKENKSFTKKIDEVRRNKKFNFWPNRGLLKMSTIHSLKGWEVDTIFLLITPEKSMYAEFVNAELIYTAITRCRTNLVVININNAKFHDFFNTAIPQFEQRNKMVQELLKKAKAGDANAQSIVGQMYYVDRSNYLGIANVDCWPQDYAKAAYWLQKAAEQGEAEAQVFLGEMYKNGDGVPQDNAKAAYWIQKSAEQGCIYGQLVLSVLYGEGKGVPQDHTKADYWFHRAAEQDDVIAESLLEPQHFNQARQEFNDGVIDQTLWTEVLITATGNEDSLKAAYIKLRAKELFWNQAEQKLNDGTVDHDLDGQEHP